MRSRSILLAAVALIGLIMASDAGAGQSNAHHRHSGLSRIGPGVSRSGASHYVDAPIGTTNYGSCPIVRRGVQTAQGLSWAYVRTCGQ